MISYKTRPCYSSYLLNSNSVLDGVLIPEDSVPNESIMELVFVPSWDRRYQRKSQEFVKRPHLPSSVKSLIDLCLCKPCIQDRSSMSDNRNTDDMKKHEVPLCPNLMDNTFGIL